MSKSRLSKIVKVNMIDNKIIDNVWDEFSEYIGEQKLNTPLSLEQFEEIFAIINKTGRYTNLKESILMSFQYDSYNWPLVVRNNIRD